MAGPSPYTGETPQVAADNAARHDGLAVSDVPVNPTYQWAMNPHFVSVGDRPAEDLYRELGQLDPSRPYAYGTVEVHSDWDALFSITSANMALHEIEKALKKWTREHRWNFEGIADGRGSKYAVLDRTAMALRPEDIPPILYHFTDVSRVPSILSDGLISTSEGGFADAATDRHGGEALFGRTGVIYLSNELGVDRYLDTAYDVFPNPALLEVSTAGLDPNHFVLDLDVLREVHQLPEEAEYAPLLAELPGLSRSQTEDDYVQYHGDSLDHLDSVSYGLRAWGVVGYRGSIPPSNLKVHPTSAVRTSSAIGEDSNGIKDWSLRDWAGTDQYGQMPPRSFGIIEPRDKEVDDDGYTCSECDQTFDDYQKALEHERTHLDIDDRKPTKGPVPVVDLDATFPPGWNESLMDMTMQRVVGSVMASSPIEITGPIPALYDVAKDRIFVGNPGQRHSDIEANPTPGATIELRYDPKGNMEVRPDADVEWTMHNMAYLWHAMLPELPIKAIYLLTGDKRTKVAGYVREASILDPIRDALPEQVFDDPESAEPNVKFGVAQWVRSYVLDMLREQGYDLDGVGLVLTGSLTTYQYSDDPEHPSDFDISIFIPDLTDKQRAQLIKVIMGGFDGKIVPDTPFPVQCYVVPGDVSRESLYAPGMRSGYDLLLNEWIVPPERARTRDVYEEWPSMIAHARLVEGKMRLLAEYAPEAATRYLRELASKRREDMRAGKGDYAPSNIDYKWLHHVGLVDDDGVVYDARPVAASIVDGLMALARIMQPSDIADHEGRKVVVLHVPDRTDRSVLVKYVDDGTLRNVPYGSLADVRPSAAPESPRRPATPVKPQTQQQSLLSPAHRDPAGWTRA